MTLKKVFFIICLIVPFISGFKSTETFCVDGDPIIIKKSVVTGSSDKDDPGITATINGHALTVNFSQNIGSVLVEISDGQSFMVVTPDTAQAYITNSGSYTVTFTLPGGDEYYGNFVVN